MLINEVRCEVGRQGLFLCECVGVALAPPAVALPDRESSCVSVALIDGSGSS